MSRPWHNPRDLDDPEVRAVFSGKTLEITDTTGARHIARFCPTAGWYPWQVVTESRLTIRGVQHTLAALVGVEVIGWRELYKSPGPNGPFKPARKLAENAAKSWNVTT